MPSDSTFHECVPVVQLVSNVCSHFEFRLFLGSDVAETDPAWNRTAWTCPMFLDHVFFDFLKMEAFGKQTRPECAEFHQRFQFDQQRNVKFELT